MINSSTSPISSHCVIASIPNHNASATREVEEGEANRAQRIAPMDSMHQAKGACNTGSQGGCLSLLERCKNRINENVSLHLYRLIADLSDTTKDIGSVADSSDWMIVVQLLTSVNKYIQIDNIRVESWLEKFVRDALTDIFSTWSEKERNSLAGQINIFSNCLDIEKISLSRPLFGLLREALERNVWVKPTNEFAPIPGERPGGSAPEMQFFVDSKGNRWLGKCGSLALYDRNQLLREVEGKDDFISPYADEILEKLGLGVYALIGVRVPESALSYQPVTEEVATEFECFSPRMHYLSKWIKNFEVLGPSFVSDYLSKSKLCGNEYVKIKTRSGEELPLIGLGSMLAAADFLYDLDCIGNQGGNAGYVIEEDSQTGSRYAQLVKIDAGYAFSYYDARYDQPHDPRKRNIRIRPDEGMLDFASLAPADRRDFAKTAKRILEIPREKLTPLFLHAEHTDEGIPRRHSEALLNGLIARKNLFLNAFVQETDRAIVEEIEAAQAKVAKELEAPEEIASETVEKLLAEEREEAKALAEMRVRLAVLDIKHSEDKKVRECKTFQLPKVATYFVGRKKVLEAIAAQLSESQGGVMGQSISGIGGVGKTQLALHYAQAAVNGEFIGGKSIDYDYVVWVNAEVFLEGQFQAMAELWTGKHLKADDAVEAVYQFLKGKRTLLVFDNAENARSISACLPPANYPSPLHFLITSRHTQWGEIPAVKLGGFSLGEAQEYVEYYLGVQSKEFVAKLVELMAGLPLAINQAVSYIKAGHSTPQEFERLFYLNQANLFSHELLLEELHPKTVGTTLTLGLAQAKTKSVIAEKVLGIIAYLVPDKIKVELVVDALFTENLLKMQARLGKNELSAELINILVRSIISEVQNALNVLESYSLISIEGEFVQVHRLVQEVMRHRHKVLNEPNIYWHKVIELLSIVVVYDDTKLERMKQCAHAIAHVLQVGKLSKMLILDKNQELILANLLELSGLHQQTIGNYKAVQTLQEQVLEIKERHYGLHHLETAKTLVSLGNAYNVLGNARKQIELQQRALAIKEGYFGPRHVEVARVRVNLSSAYYAIGDMRTQLELLEYAFPIIENHYGKDHVEVASVLVNLSGAYGALGYLQKRMKSLRRALPVFEKHYGQDHVKVAKTLYDLGIAYSEAGDLENAMESLQRALRIKERYYGKDHVELAKSLWMLGNVYGALGNGGMMIESLRRALKIQKRFYGNDHVEVARTLVSLGNAHGVIGEIPKMVELLQRALKIQEKFYGKDNIEVAKTLESLGNAYQALGDVRVKLKLLQRALDIEERHYGYNNIRIAPALFELGSTFLVLEQLAEAESCARKAYHMFKSCYGENHLVTHGAKKLLIECQIRQGNRI